MLSRNKLGTLQIIWWNYKTCKCKHSSDQIKIENFILVFLRWDDWFEENTMILYYTQTYSDTIYWVSCEALCVWTGILTKKLLHQHTVKPSLCRSTLLIPWIVAPILEPLSSNLWTLFRWRKGENKSSNSSDEPTWTISNRSIDESIELFGIYRATWD